MGKSIRKILAALRKADQDYNLIEDGDEILIGVSGGKDSLTLVKALSLYRYFSSKNFTFYPVYLDLGFGEVDTSSIEKYCKECGSPLSLIDERFVYEALKSNQKEGHHLPCSICSRMKKAAMKDIAEEHHYNKIAFAHHEDDLIETLYLNAIKSAKLSTFAPKMRLDKNITFIRPFYYVKEKDIASFVKEENVPVLPSICPADKHTDREVAKHALLSLYKQDPESEKNLFHLLNNGSSFYLPFLDLEYQIENTPYSLKPIMDADSMRLSSFKGKKKEGEEDYLILSRGKIIGEIGLYFLNPHKIALFHLLGDVAAKKAAINKLIEMKKARITPLTVILLGERKEFALALGFEQKRDIADGRIRYMKRT